MNTRYLIPLAFISAVLFYTSCSPSQASPISPTISPDSKTMPTQATRTSTLLVWPTKALFPTLTETPTATPEPGLRTDGPYLVYVRETGDKRELVIMDADGMGRKTLPFQTTAFPWSLEQLVSPDGKWLAFYSGSAGDPFGHVGTDTADLTLHLMNLENGGTKTVTKLLSDDYPDNFETATREINKPDIEPQTLRDSFTNGITQAIDWSPDGRYLAFAGQMNGLSSDLYVYDTRTESIKQLSSGPQQMQWIGWSPDGEWIVYGSTFVAGMGMEFDIYATTLDGAITNHLITSTGAYDAPTLWLDDRHFFDNDSENGPGNYRLRVINIESGGIGRIWDGDFDGLTYVLGSSWIAFNAFFPSWEPPPDMGDFQAGVQLVNLSTLERVIVKITNKNDLYWAIPAGMIGGKFLVEGEGNLLLLSMDGTLTDSEIGNGNVIGSPDSKYLLVVNDEIKVYSEKMEFLRSLDLPKDLLQNIIWRPDSSGFFAIAYRTNLYAVDLLSGDYHLVETNYSISPNENYAWINP